MSDLELETEVRNVKKNQKLSIKRLIVTLEVIQEPRRRGGNFKHKLIDILIMALLAIICGCESWEDVEEYAEIKQEWLKEHLPLENGIPSADTFRRVFERIKPTELEEAYRQWVLPYVGGCLKKQISLDGKTIRGASNKRGPESKIHIVSAWVHDDGISLGQIKTDEKSNEITAIPQLLTVLDIKGGVVTIDAMGCQKTIAKEIVAREASYILAVKMNQPTLYEEMKTYFEWAVHDETERKNIDRYKKLDKDRGRICSRRVTSTTDIVWFESKDEWPDLRTMVMLERRTTVKDKVTEEKQYFISNMEISAEEFCRLIREHWSIENKLHWVLDATFHEDQSLISNKNSPENLSILRKIGMALLKKNPKATSLRRKQKIAGWDNSFMTSLFD